MTKSDAIRAIIAECREQGVTMLEQIAYVLATADHETGGTMEPVYEAHYLRNPLRYLRGLRYYPFYGRGHVQLTWETNYRKYEKILGLPLVAQPDLVKRFDVSVFILVHGMRTGTFTGKKLSDSIRPGRVDLRGARRIVNGTDKADRIAKLALGYLSKLKTGIFDSIHNVTV